MMLGDTEEGITLSPRAESPILWVFPNREFPGESIINFGCYSLRDYHPALGAQSLCHGTTKEVPCLCLWLACVTPGKLPQWFICQTEEQSLFSSDSHRENESPYIRGSEQCPTRSGTSRLKPVFFSEGDGGTQFTEARRHKVRG